MGEGEKTASASRRRRWWVTGLVVSGLAVLLLNPFTLLLGAYYVAVPIESALVPACRTRTYDTGEHLGFRVGMSREEAAAKLEHNGRLRFVGVSGPMLVGDSSGATLTHQDGSTSRLSLGDLYPRSRSALLAVTAPDLTWSVTPEPEPDFDCIAMSRWTKLVFRNERLVRIIDSVEVDWI